MSNDKPAILTQKNLTSKDLENYRNEGWEISQKLLSDKEWVGNVPEGGLDKKMEYVMRTLWKTGKYRGKGIPHLLLYNVMAYLQYDGVNMEIPYLEWLKDDDLIKKNKKDLKSVGL